MKKLIAGLVCFLLGCLLVTLGSIGAFRYSPPLELTDQQVIERAKELGMIDLKTYLEMDKVKEED